MDIHVGIVNVNRELTFESDLEAADVEKLVSDAISGKAEVIRFADVKGNLYLVPVAQLAYVHAVSEATRRVGFVA